MTTTAGSRIEQYGGRRWIDPYGSRIVELAAADDGSGRIHQYRRHDGREQVRVLDSDHRSLDDGSPWSDATISVEHHGYHPIMDELGGSWSDVLEIVRRIVGRRWRITRREAAEILRRAIDAGVDPRNSCVRCNDAEGWLAMVRGITVVSVLPIGGHADGEIRYDQPGSMHPAMMASIMLTEHAESLPHLRRHARRVLLVVP